MDIHAKDLELFRTSLTHRSAAGERWRSEIDGPSTTSNERLEFYGDAILGAVVAEYLYNRFPDATEGTLTRRRSALVRSEQLTAWARELKLEDYLYLAQSERIAEGGKDRLLAGAFEAMIGAIVIDQGVDYVITFIHDLLDRDVDRVLAGVKYANPKGQLQELTQNRHRECRLIPRSPWKVPRTSESSKWRSAFRGFPWREEWETANALPKKPPPPRRSSRIRSRGPKMLDAMVSGQPDERVGE